MTDIGQGTKVSPPSVPGDDARRLLAEAEEAIGDLMYWEHHQPGDCYCDECVQLQNRPAVRRALETKRG